MGIDFGFFFTLAAVGYVINALASRELTADRLLLRAPIVAVFATLLYGPVTAVAGMFVGALVFLPVVCWDVTPGRLLGKHA